MTAAIFGDLGQEDLPAAALTVAYTVPASRRAVVTATFCNRTAAPIAVRLALAPGGAADDPAHYKLYDTAVPANDSLTSPRAAMAAGDKLRGFAAAVGVTMTVNGIEEDG